MIRKSVYFKLARLPEGVKAAVFMVGDDFKIVRSDGGWFDNSVNTMLNNCVGVYAHSILKSQLESDIEFMEERQ